MSGTDTRTVKEYRHINTLLSREGVNLPDEERLALARRLIVIAPGDADSWWSLATEVDWMLRDLHGGELLGSPLVEELINAWDRAAALDPNDSAAPYNKSRILRRLGRLQEAYAALMLAGKTEQEHPNLDVEWPADWHYEDAAAVALELHDRDLALAAAQAAVAAGAADSSATDLLDRLDDETARRPT